MIPEWYARNSIGLSAFDIAKIRSGSKKVQDCRSRLNASRAARNSFAGRMFNSVEHKLSELHVRKPEQNTALNATTKQCATAKISGNALKLGSRTYTTPQVGSSQLQKHQVARMSRWIGAVEQKRYADGIADTKVWQFETCLTTQELRMRITYARNFFLLLCGANTGSTEQVQTCLGRYDDPDWTAN